MHSQAKRLFKLALSPVLLLLSLLSTGAWAEEAQRWQMNMSPGVTEVGAEIYDLHMIVMWICVDWRSGFWCYVLLGVYSPEIKRREACRFS